MEILFQLEELEKRIANIRKNSVLQSELQEEKNRLTALIGRVDSLETTSLQIQENKNNITTITASLNDCLEQVETLETSLSTTQETLADIENQASILQTTVNGINSEIDNLEISVEDVETQLSQLASNLESVESGVIGIQNSMNSISLEIDEFQTNITALETQINTVNTDLEVVKSDINDLDERVSSLESGGGSSGSGDVTETFNMGVKEKFMSGKKGDTNNSEYLFFRCEPTARIKGNIAFRFTSFPTDIDSIKFYLYADNEDELIEECEYLAPFNQEQTLNFKFEFFPVKNNYRLKFKLGDTELVNAILEDYTIELEGRNIIILNRHHEMHIQVLDNVYHITKQTSNVGKYLEQTTLNLDEEGTVITDLTGKTFAYKTYKHTLFNKATQSWRPSTIKYILTLSNSGTHKLNMQNFGTTNLLWLGDNIYDMYYSAKSGQTLYYIVGTTLDGMPKIALYNHFNGSNQANYVVKVNNVQVENKFVQCIPVYDNYLTTRLNSKTAGFILLDNNGKIYYIPDRIASYIIEVGQGSQPNAYIQQDNNTIHIYYTFCNTTIKKKLVRSSENQPFELSSSIEKIVGTTEFIEGLNGISVQKINGEYKVVNPS